MGDLDVCGTGVVVVVVVVGCGSRITERGTNTGAHLRKYRWAHSLGCVMEKAWKRTEQVEGWGRLPEGPDPSG